MTLLEPTGLLEFEHLRGGEPCGQGRATPWMTAFDDIGHPPNTRASVRTCAYLWTSRAAGNAAHAGTTRCHPQSTALITTTAFPSIILITTESESM